MAMIEVKHLQKNFVKTVKEPGLKGALRSFIHPEKQTFEAVKNLTFEVPKGQILGFIVPFAFTAYYPASYFLQGKDGLFNIGGLILISLVFFFISLKLWDRGLDAYESAGL